MTQIKKAFSTGNKPNEVVSVRDFGAVGDGVTDDTAAIQAALDSANTQNKALHFPSGTYLTTSEITTTEEGIVIYGEGSELVIINTTATRFLFVDTPDTGTPGTPDQPYLGVRLEGFQVRGDGVNTTTCIDVFGSPYGNTVFKDLQLRGAITEQIKITQCWASEFVNCEIGFGSESRTTSGTRGITIDNANAITVRDSIITSLGLNYDGLGIYATSCEAFNLVSSTIENMQTYVEITSGSGSVLIQGNYFENSTTVQGLIDITESPIKLGTTGKLYNAEVCNNWFLVGNNAINVDFVNVSKGAFKQNSHNPGLANDGYYKAGVNSTDIIVENNKRIFSPTSGVSGMTDSDVENTLNARNKLDSDSMFIPASQFISRSIGGPITALPTQSTLNGATVWNFNTTDVAEVSTIVMPPQVWGKSRVKTYGVFSIDSTSTNSIVYFAIPTVLEEDGTETDPSVLSKTQGLTDIAAANVPVPDTNGSSWIVARNNRLEGVKVRFRRSGNNASDTFTGTVSFFGMILERSPEVV